MVVCALDTGQACCVGTVHLLDTLIRRKLPSASDAGAPDAYYQYPVKKCKFMHVGDSGTGFEKVSEYSMQNQKLEY